MNSLSNKLLISCALIILAYFSCNSKEEKDDVKYNCKKSIIFKFEPTIQYRKIEPSDSIILVMISYVDLNERMGLSINDSLVFNKTMELDRSHVFKAFRTSDLILKISLDDADLLKLDFPIEYSYMKITYFGNRVEVRFCRSTGCVS
jgi:hypothetical protein